MPRKALIFSYSSGRADDGILNKIKAEGDRYFEYALWTPANESHENATALREKIRQVCENKNVEIKTVPLEAIYDFEKCYELAAEWLKRRWMKAYPTEDIDIDYTAGMRDVAFGLIFAGYNLGLRTFVRMDSEKIGEKFHTRDPNKKTDISRIVNDGYFMMARAFFGENNYEAAKRILAQINVDLLVVVSPRFGRMFKHLNEFYLRWDLFDHAGARAAAADLDTDGEIKKLCAAAMPNFNVHRQAVGILASSAGKAKGHPKDILADLLNNAERRFAQGKYDDAVARLYRAVEALAGLALQELGIDTSNVDPAKAPAGPARDYCKKLEMTREKRQLGLYKSYELLALMPQEKYSRLGKIFMANKELHQKLEARNNSILAHGYAAVGELAYKDIKESLLNLVRNYYTGIDEQMKTIAFPKIVSEPVDETSQNQD